MFNGLGVLQLYRIFITKTKIMKLPPSDNVVVWALMQAINLVSSVSSITDPSGNNPISNYPASVHPYPPVKNIKFTLMHQKAIKNLQKKQANLSTKIFHSLIASSLTLQYWLNDHPSIHMGSGMQGLHSYQRN